jgi:hypothetical protein
MLRGAQECVGLRLELINTDPRECSENAAQESAYVRVVASVMLDHHFAEPGVVALIRRLPGLALAQVRVGIRHLE